MKLYVAEAGWAYEGFEILGIFSTIEQAQECLDTTAGSYSIKAIESFQLDERASGA